MFNKRIAGLVAGTALAASAVIIPQVSAQELVQNQHGVWGSLITVNTQQHGAETVVFLPNGVTLLPIPTTTPVSDDANCFTHNGNKYINYNYQQITDQAGNSVVDGKSYGTIGDKCATGTYTEPEKPSESSTSSTTPEKPSESSSSSSTSSTSSSSTSSSTEKPPVIEPTEDASSISDGSALGLLGLSALAGSALLSSGSGSAVADGSAASSDNKDNTPSDKGEGPATGPVAGDDAKADAQQGKGPATGPVAGNDPKAAAQAQAANAPAYTKGNAPAAAEKAPAQAAAKQQLANTGVAGTMIAIAAGLLAAAAGAALLVLRRRA